MWAMQLSYYDSKIKYLSGKENTCTDLLSRIPEVVEEEADSNDQNLVSDNNYRICVLNSQRLKNRPPEIEIEVDQEEDDPEEDSWESIDLELFKIEATKDKEYSKLKKPLIEENLPPSKLKRYLIEDDKVYYVTGEEEIPTLRLYFPEGKVRASLSKITHDGLGHVGIDKTYSIMIRKYYWPGMFKHIHSFGQPNKRRPSQFEHQSIRKESWLTHRLYQWSI